MSTLPERLKEARKGAGITQAQLAKTLKVSQGTIGNIEAGTREHPRDIVRLAAAVGVSASWLETGEGPKDPNAAPPPEWPFEFITREQWTALSERQRGAVEGAAHKAFMALPLSPQ